MDFYARLYLRLNYFRFLFIFRLPLSFSSFHYHSLKFFMRSLPSLLLSSLVSSSLVFHSTREDGLSFFLTLHNLLFLLPTSVFVYMDVCLTIPLSFPFEKQDEWEVIWMGVQLGLSVCLSSLFISQSMDVNSPMLVVVKGCCLLCLMWLFNHKWKRRVKEKSETQGKSEFRWNRIIWRSKGCFFPAHPSSAISSLPSFLSISFIWAVKYEEGRNPVDWSQVGSNKRKGNEDSNEWDKGMRQGMKMEDNWRSHLGSKTIHWLKLSLSPCLYLSCV